MATSQVEQSAESTPTRSEIENVFQSLRSLVERIEPTYATEIQLRDCEMRTFTAYNSYMGGSMTVVDLRTIDTGKTSIRKVVSVLNEFEIDVVLNRGHSGYTQFVGLPGFRMNDFYRKILFNRFQWEGNAVFSGRYDWDAAKPSGDARYGREHSVVRIFPEDAVDRVEIKEVFDELVRKCQKSPPMSRTTGEGVESLTDPVLIFPKFCERFDVHPEDDVFIRTDHEDGTVTVEAGRPDLRIFDHGDGTVTMAARNPDTIYVDHGDGAVTDVHTGLMWKQCAEGLSGANCQSGSAQAFTWGDALARAEASTFANYADWRLPSYEELRTLTERCRRTPAINTHRFPNTPSFHFWSSSSGPYGPSSSWEVESAWTVDFGDGTVSEIDQNQDRDRSNRSVTVRLVRWQ
jgi:hypothetical protein